LEGNETQRKHETKAKKKKNHRKTDRQQNKECQTPRIRTNKITEINRGTGANME
jgi:hypothetical protein